MGSNGNVIIRSNWQYHFKYWRHHHKLTIVYQNTYKWEKHKWCIPKYKCSRKYYIDHFHLCYTFVWPYLILKTFSIYNAFFYFYFFYNISSFSRHNSLSFNIFGLFQKYFEYTVSSDLHVVYILKKMKLIFNFVTISAFPFINWCPIGSSLPSNFNF